MSPVRTLSRPLLASMFVLGGAESLVRPGSRVERVRAAGLDRPEQLVRANGLAMTVAGLALAAGRLPRVSAAVLAATLLPTTVVGHPFWAERDPAVRAGQRAHFVKNLGLLGGLLATAADTGGRESVPHAAGRLGRKARRALAD